MTRDNVTSRAREATGYMVAVSTLTDTPAGPDTSSGTPAPAWSLTTALPGLFMVTLDAVIVNVALPDIRRELRRS